MDVNGPGFGYPHAVRPTWPAHPLDQVSAWWKVRYSAWALWPVLSIGMLSWVGFAYIAIRARRRAWGLAAGLYGLAIVAIFVLIGFVPDVPTSEMSTTESTVETLSGVLILALWAGSSAHAFGANASWLRWRAEAKAAWLYQMQPPYPPAPPFPIGGTYPLPVAPNPVVPSAALPLPPSPGPVVPSSATAGPPGAGPVDATPGPSPDAAAPPRSRFDAALADAIATRQRFDALLATVRPGPLYAALDRLSWALESAVSAVARTAQRTAEVERTLAAVQADDGLGPRREPRFDWANPGAPTADAEYQASVARLTAALERSVDQLRLLNARLDGVVARAAEIAVAAGGGGTAAHDLGGMVDELDTLRSSLEQASL